MRGLLAGTCLTAATAAHANTIIESGNDFPQSLSAALASPLPVGTDTVEGSVADGTSLDFVDFAGLLPGGIFDAQFSILTQTGTLNFSVLDSSGASLGSPGSPQNSVASAEFTGIIPADGQLVAEVSNSEGVTYQISLTTVPEPATATLGALGLAAGLLASRRRKQSR